MEQLKWRSLVSQVTAFRRAAQEKHTCWAIFHYVCMFKASGGLVLTTCSLEEKKKTILEHLIISVVLAHPSWQFQAFT